MSKKASLINTRMDQKLAPQEINRIRPALLEYLDTEELAPEK